MGVYVFNTPVPAPLPALNQRLNALDLPTPESNPQHGLPDYY